MQKRKYKVILDTNLWIKFLLSGGLEAIDILLENDELEIIVSEELVNELDEVLLRPKFSKVISLHKTRAIKQFIENYTTTIPVVSTVQVCRNAKDNFLLALAIDANVDFIITGDKDLLVLNPYKQVEIIDYRSFLNRMLDSNE